MTRKTTHNHQIAEEAAEWAITLDNAPLLAHDRQQLVIWLKASPVHVEELLLTVSLLAGLSQIDPEKKILIDTLLSEAEETAEIISLEQHHAPAPTPPAPSRRSFRVAVAAAAALLITGGALLTFNSFAPEPDYIIETTLGEQRTVPLSDGSIINVNTKSRIRINMTDNIRRIELLEGEAFFDVEHDPTRPFRVITGDAVTEAIGTKFNVRYLDEGTVVSVMEGTVAIGTKGLPIQDVEHVLISGKTVIENPGPERFETGRLILTVGERVSFSSHANIPVIQTADVKTIASWRTRQLIFKGDELAAITAEFNRYNPTQLIVTDNGLATEKFSGVFDADDPASFVEFLEYTGDITVSRSGNKILLSPNRNTP